MNASHDEFGSAAAPQYLTFCLGDEEYALPILRVREIIRYETITRVPGTPPFLRGVINLRGSVVPVVDLGVRFGLEAAPVTPATCIVIAEVAMSGGAQAVLGVKADAVRQVIDLLPSEIEPPPSFGTIVRPDYLVGMGRTAGERFILVLDMDRVLSSEEVAAIDPVAVAPEPAGSSAPGTGEVPVPA